MNIREREALQTHETPYGSVGVIHDGADLEAWWIWKDDEAVDPEWSEMEREDLLYVIEGTLRLELEGDPPRDLDAGECFVIPAGRRFRGYRWPRNGAAVPVPRGHGRCWAVSADRVAITSRGI